MSNFFAAFSPLQKQDFFTELDGRSSYNPLNSTQIKAKDFVETFALREKLIERKKAIEEGNFPVLGPRAAVIGACSALVLLGAAGVALVVLAVFFFPHSVGLVLGLVLPGTFMAGWGFSLPIFFCTNVWSHIFEDTNVSNLESRIQANQAHLEELLGEDTNSSTALEQLENIKQLLTKQKDALSAGAGNRNGIGALNAKQNIKNLIDQYLIFTQTLQDLERLKEAYQTAQTKFHSLSPSSNEE